MPRTIFRPAIDGFAFVNSWTFDQNETDQVRGAFTAAVNGALILLGGPFGGALALFGVGSALTNWVAGSGVIQYGLCGGMAFGALDYYKAGLVVPRGTSFNDVPDRTTPAGVTLRNYLWQRLLDSLSTGGAAASTLAWMAVLHLIPKEWPFLGGHAWLLAKSREHWNTLKGHIDAGEPWPIGLVGTTSVPFFNHQVLAYGYDDPGDGTGTIYVYDMNCPGNEQALQVDFRGEMLVATESCPNSDRGPLRGFFCEAYSPVPPPDVGLSYGALQRETSKPEVYVIFGGAKFWIPSPEEFDALGYSSDWVKVVPDGALAAVPSIPRDGTLLKERSRPEVYATYGGAKFWIPSLEEFDALGYSWDWVRLVPDGALAAVPSIPRDGALLRERSNPAVYVIRGGAKIHITSPQRFAELGYSWSDIRVAPDGALASIPFGGYDPPPLAQLSVSVQPYPVPLDQSVQVTVFAKDSATQAPIAGTVDIHNFSASGLSGQPVNMQVPSNAPFTITLHTFTESHYDPETGNVEREEIYPAGSVSAPGYQGAEIDLGYW